MRSLEKEYYSYPMSQILQQLIKDTFSIIDDMQQYRLVGIDNKIQQTKKDLMLDMLFSNPDGQIFDKIFCVTRITELARVERECVRASV